MWKEKQDKFLQSDYIMSRNAEQAAKELRDCRKYSDRLQQAVLELFCKVTGESLETYVDSFQALHIIEEKLKEKLCSNNTNKK